MSYEPPDTDPRDDAGPWPAYQPPGQSDDVVEFGGLGRAGGSRRLVIGAAVAVVALLGGAGVAYAASGSGSAAPNSAAASPSPSPSPSPSVSPPSVRCRFSVKGAGSGSGSMKACPPFGRFPFRRPFGFPAGLPGGIGFPSGPGGAVHGQFVVPKSGGRYETVDTQRGQVTAVSAGSVTVKSADGFSATYAVSGSTIVDAQRDGIGSVKNGNQVSIVATVSGSKATATATSITDLSLVQHGGGAFGFGGSSSR